MRGNNFSGLALGRNKGRSGLALLFISGRPVACLACTSMTLRTTRPKQTADLVACDTSIGYRMLSQAMSIAAYICGVGTWSATMPDTKRLRTSSQELPSSEFLAAEVVHVWGPCHARLVAGSNNTQRNDKASHTLLALTYAPREGSQANATAAG